ncbi:MAG: hypothetical protein QOH16_233 [Gaiellaceae bacterium]|nr:hypothetical protein [Gaiellaceae bacterium]
MLLSGCGGGGGGPHLARDDAARLITLADRIAREAPCAQARDIRALSALRTTLINAHKVPPALQDPLSSGVNALATQTPPCLPSVPAATVTPAPITIVPAHGKAHGHGGHHDKRKGKGKD